MLHRITQVQVERNDAAHDHTRQSGVKRCCTGSHKAKWSEMMLHRITQGQASQYSSMAGPGLLGKRMPIFFKVVSSDRSSSIQWIAHTESYDFSQVYPNKSSLCLHTSRGTTQLSLDGLFVPTVPLQTRHSWMVQASGVWQGIRRYCS